MIIHMYISITWMNIIKTETNSFEQKVKKKKFIIFLNQRTYNEVLKKQNNLINIPITFCLYNLVC